MRFDVLEPLARLATTAEAIEGLRDLFAAEEPLDDMAARAAATVVAAIPYADAVSIAVVARLLTELWPPHMSGHWNSITISTRQAGVRPWKPRGTARGCAR